MSKYVFTNDASSLLAVSINDVETVLQVGSTEGDLFPSPSGGDVAAIALRNANGDLEIVNCTSRSGDLLTVVRGQEGTTAQSWTGGQTRVELRLTKETMEAMIQRGGDAMAGDLNMDENELQDALITGANTVMSEGQIVGVPLRGAVGDASNEIVVPDDGTPATMGGSPLLTQAQLMPSMPAGAVIMWYGSLGSLPSGWQLCNGTNGTPDMRDKFAIGAGGSVALGANVGGATTTGAGGAISGTTGSHTLTAAEMPAHGHRVWANNDGTSTGAHGLSSGSGRTVAGYPSTGGAEAYATQTGGGATEEIIENTGGGGAHSHSISAAAHTHAVDPTPASVGLYFIMKLAA